MDISKKSKTTGSISIWVKAVKICIYQLNLLCYDYKLRLIPIVTFIVCRNMLMPVREFLLAVGESATPFGFPFLLSDPYLASILFTGAVFFFADAPFYTDIQMYPIIRSGIHAWILGRIIYIGITSVLYTVFCTFSSICFLFPYIKWNGSWGRAWTTLAMTSAKNDFGISLWISPEIILGWNPYKAVIVTMLLFGLICFFYGVLLWFMNLIMGKKLSLALNLASLLLYTRVRFFPAWVFYLVPSAWINIGGLSEYASHGMSVYRAVVVLCLAITLLSICVFWKTSRSEIGKL